MKRLFLVLLLSPCLAFEPEKDLLFFENHVKALATVFLADFENPTTPPMEYTQSRRMYHDLSTGFGINGHWYAGNTEFGSATGSTHLPFSVKSVNQYPLSGTVTGSLIYNYRIGDDPSYGNTHISIQLIKGTDTITVATGSPVYPTTIPWPEKNRVNHTLSGSATSVPAGNYNIRVVATTDRYTGSFFVDDIKIEN